MNLGTAIKRFRVNPLRDIEQPYLWGDEELEGYFNECVNELCEETFLLVDSRTPETSQVIIGVTASNWDWGTNTATLATTTPIKFYNRYRQLTFPVQDNIAMSSCDVQDVSTFCKYIIATDGSLNITIIKGSTGSNGVASLPNCPDGLTPIGMFSVQTDDSHTFACGTNSLGDAGITAIFLSSSNIISLHPKVLRVEAANMANNSFNPITFKDLSWADRMLRGWRAADPSMPAYMVCDQNSREFTLYPNSLYPDKLILTVARRPMVEMTLDSEFEIPEEYVKLLYDGVAHLCFGKQDSETFDSEKSIGHYKKWQAGIEKVKRSELKKRLMDVVNEVPRGAL